MTARRNALQQWQEAGCSGHSIGSLQHPKTLGCRSAQPAPDCLFCLCRFGCSLWVQHHAFCRAAGAMPGSLPGPCRELSWGCFRHPGLQILRNFGGRVLAGRNENWEKNLKSGLFSAPRGLQICAGCSENCGTRDLASPSALKKCTGTKRTPRRSRS
eukprot:scaffold138496_cov63-Phaeocystis_antarctica.AAC.2